MFLSQVASALHYLHKNHIVHGDLRAEYVNVMASNKVRSGQTLARMGRRVCQFLFVSLFNGCNKHFRAAVTYAPKRVSVHNLSYGKRFFLYVDYLKNQTRFHMKG